MTTQLLSSQTISDQLPAHLRPFVVEQQYERYSPEDQAVWRYIMRRNASYLKKVAHPAYFEGLSKTGISNQRIPDINTMNARMAELGWQVVIVDGFVPPSAFMEFQAHKILPISAEMRTIDHILYTPAPDIVHEAAGHAPLIAVPEYAEFLQRFGEYGAKAVYSKEDFELYEAIRKLSVLKESAGVEPSVLDQAETQVEQLQQQITSPSEANKLSRLHWWTVEYGLFGSLKDPQIIGAGLLSSVGESKACLHPSVKKLPLSLDAVDYAYDITTMQPQLFVTPSFDHMLEVLESFADTMSFRIGGSHAVEQVIASEQVGTLELDSGLQISGQFVRLIKDEAGNPAYVETTQATALAFEHRNLDGLDQHALSEGWSSPIGKLNGIDKPLSEFDEGNLLTGGIIPGHDVTLEYESGIQLRGTVEHIIRKAGSIIVITFSNCLLLSADDQLLFSPEEGLYHLAVGAEVISAYSGTADKEAFNTFSTPSPTNTPLRNWSYEDQPHALLHRLATLDEPDSLEISRLFEEATESIPHHWLFYIELLRINKRNGNTPLTRKITQHLSTVKQNYPKTDEFIESDPIYQKFR
ncbi:MAG: aromatic amino acid hydroxylase [Bacteroidota bacterium]